MTRPVPALSGALLLALGLVLPACGAEEPEAPTPSGAEAAATAPPAVPEDGAGAAAEATPASAPEPKVAFLDGFAAGVKAAEGPDQLLFVYVGRHSPT